MDRDLYQRVDAVIREVCDLPDTARRRRIDELTGDDPELKREVLALLSVDDEGDDAMLRTGHGAVLEAPLSMPERIGAYIVIRPLGIGGMGVVYEAEQANPKRRVAIKLLRTTSASPQAVTRFRQEAEALGRLRHACVAQIFESGEADTGRGAEPFIAMELIEGVPLDQHFRDLDQADRIRIFIEVCEGVEAAHAVGVIHRDLKPANILVESRGPRILDFGVARLVGGDSLTHTQMTSGIVGTVAYMSPEQVEGGPIDERADVYSLGVILFEAVAGRLPLDLADTSLPEAIRLVRESEPRTLRSISTRFSGDLDTIVAKSMARETDRRYASVHALRQDLERYLRNEPIAARPPSRIYRTRKFVRRHRPLVASVASVFVVLVAAIIVISLLFARSERLRRDAERSLVRAEALGEFLTDDMFGAVQINELGFDARLIDVLDAAAARLPDRFAADAEMHAILEGQVAHLYRNLGEVDKATAYFDGAVEKLTDSLGSDAPDTIYHEALRIEHLQQLGRLDQAESLGRDAMIRAERALGPNHRTTLIIKTSYASILSALRRYDDVQQIIEPVIEQRRATGDPDLLLSLNVSSSSLQSAGRYEEAIVLIEEQIRISRQSDPPDIETIMACNNNLSVIYFSMGRYEEAIPILYELIGMVDEHMAPGSWLRGLPRYSLARALVNVGRFDEAMTLYDESLAIFQSSVGMSHWMSTRVWGDRIRCLVNDARYDMALEQSDALFEELVELNLQGTPSANPGPAFGSRRFLAEQLVDDGRLADAERALATSRRILEEQFSDGFAGIDDARAEILITMAYVALRDDRPEQALELLDQADAVLTEDSGVPSEVMALRAKIATEARRDAP